MSDNKIFDCGSLAELLITHTNCEEEYELHYLAYLFVNAMNTVHGNTVFTTDFIQTDEGIFSPSLQKRLEELKKDLDVSEPMDTSE